MQLNFSYSVFLKKTSHSWHRRLGSWADCRLVQPPHETQRKTFRKKCTHVHTQQFSQKSFSWSIRRPKARKEGQMCFWFHEIDLELKANIELLRNINRNIFVQTKSPHRSVTTTRQQETWKAPQPPPTPHIVTEPLGLLNGCQSKVLTSTGNLWITWKG